MKEEIRRLESEIKAIDEGVRLTNDAITIKDREFPSTIFHYILPIVTGLILGLLGNYTVFNIRIVAAAVPSWAIIISLPIIGIALYALKYRIRLIYGIAEFVFGVASAVSVFFPNFDYSQLQLASSITVAGSLYVMVRGMDNIGEALRDTSLEQSWKKIFKND